jgi:hypothetical protein
MRILDPGHHFALEVIDDIFGTTKQSLTFVKRNNPPEKYPGNEGCYAGTTSQEVMRALIARAKYVDQQAPHHANKTLIESLRTNIWNLEIRAAEKHNRKLNLERITADMEVANPLDITSIIRVEFAPVCIICGHIDPEGHNHYGPEGT